MKLIITSEMRCGSRWLHYLLADLYGMRVSPEIDRGVLDERAASIRKYMRGERIAKLHHATPEDIFRYIKPRDYTVIGVTRNPRDRGTSRAFHLRYGRNGEAKWCDSDQEAVQKTVTSQGFFESNARQLELMQSGYSTQRHTKDEIPYIWTTYEWMLDDIASEVAALTNYFGLNISEEKISKTCFQHSFEAKSGRLKGNEERNNRWRRKGTMCDWLNWFDEDLFLGTQAEQNKYWKQLLINKG